MRQIGNGSEPQALTEWRLRTPGVGYNNMPGMLRDEVKASLIADQRHLCAYTGIRISGDSSHIEHLVAQDHCVAGQDIAYDNFAACHPAPGRFAPYGAVRKGNWPSPDDNHLFVSPRSNGCEARFAFTFRGDVRATNANDAAAVETIKRLGLDHRTLNALRREAIDATLAVKGKGFRSLDVKSARKRLKVLEEADETQDRLEPFCFVLKQVLRKHISQLEAIAASKRNSVP